MCTRCMLISCTFSIRKTFLCIVHNSSEWLTFIFKTSLSVCVYCFFSLPFRSDTALYKYFCINYAKAQMKLTSFQYSIEKTEKKSYNNHCKLTTTKKLKYYMYAYNFFARLDLKNPIVNQKKTEKNCTK